MRDYTGAKVMSTNRRSPSMLHGSWFMVRGPWPVLPATNRSAQTLPTRVGAASERGIDQQGLSETRSSFVAANGFQWTPRRGFSSPLSEKPCPRGPWTQPRLPR
jgi:hypothetical protein